ncbi:MAG: carboxypeptidase-like regulatory domain-containing protein, partial [Planctomycetota bacterium]|nr:carboxypeptidase-like regulatory domain-containing protein [Planctomycetota bacterium]
MLKRMAITCALVLLLGGPVLAEDTGQLAVKITDPEGKPLAGVQVMAWTREHVLSGTTGADGMWRSTASPGEYAVGVRAHSRVGTERYEITVAAGETTEIEFELEPGVTFIGRVVDAEGEPVVGADVVVEAGGTYDGYMEHTFGVPPWARDRTNAKGEFFVGGIPDTKVATVVVSAEGYQTTRMGIRAMDGAIHPDPVVVRLRAGASVSGRVTMPDRKPAAGATVYVIPTDVPQLLKSPTSWVSGDNGSQERALQATTEDDGSYRVEGAQIDREYLV